MSSSGVGTSFSRGMLSQNAFTSGSLLHRPFIMAICICTYSNFSKIIKERGIDLHQQEQAIESELSTHKVPMDTMLPDAPELALDKYPMPDSDLTIDDLKACEYLDSDLLPLSKERALELFEQDLTVYIHAVPRPNSRDQLGEA